MPKTDHSRFDRDGSPLDPVSRHAASIYAATAVGEEDDPRAEGDLSADVAVIGGGLTGLSAALHLAQSGARTILLEAERAGWGASGRNGGQVLPGFSMGASDLVKAFGLDTAQALWRHSEAAMELVRILIDRHAIACDWQDGAIHAAVKGSHMRQIEEEAQVLERDFAAGPIEVLDRAALTARVAARGYHGGAVYPGGGHLHPLNFALGLARAARRAGAQLFAHSPVTRLDHTGVGYRLNTPRAAIEAGQVILAGDGYLAPLAPKVSRRVHAIGGFIAATAPLPGETVRALIPSRACVADSLFALNYFRIDAQNRLIFGGGESPFARLPRDLEGPMRARIASVFPQLERPQITHVWGGRIAITPTRFPQIGSAGPGLWVAHGFSGQGNALAPYAGKLLAEAAGGTAAPLEPFARAAPPAMPGTALMRAMALRAAFAWGRLMDALP